ncbi:MAG TPA: cell wall hydrolase [Rhizomicrobium sp.]|jgi:spore germination cell wall hydrolase CwlJ-like protein|nr:cell wall hydrolase [Rhizomicrobium sp.]
MTKKSLEAFKRADRALMGAVAIVAITAGAAYGAMNYHPSTEQFAARAKPVVELAIAPAPAANPNLVAASIVPLPKPTLSDLAKSRILAEHRCLAEAMYYEARGEGVEGEEAVAEVVIHRMRDRNFPHSICGVVYQGAGHQGCQFSWACNGEMLRPKTRYAWYESQLLAAKIMTGAIHLNDVTEDAINFHAVNVSPQWADHMVRTIQIGNHVFYRWARTRQS